MIHCVFCIVKITPASQSASLSSPEAKLWPAHTSEGKFPSALFCRKIASCIPIVGKRSAVAPNGKACQLCFCTKEMSAEAGDLKPCAWFRVGSFLTPLPSCLYSLSGAWVTRIGVGWGGADSVAPNERCVYWVRYISTDGPETSCCVSM